ncbi:uncharacterized protein LOC142177932 [Nicotiana tabacum]|uniref:Uncharacterized protein LOC142177932 n=1 Tax=Nicotiana tabacum TaxID=4097 RepID=A0AC58U0V0_TOBAC
MKDLWDELDVIAPLASCDCEESRPSVELLKNIRLLQFLMGLNESYGNIRSKGHEFKPKRSGLICDHCGYKGHLKENCYKIVGYPPDFKSKKKGQNLGGKTYVNSATSEEKHVPMLPTQGNFFIEEQYKQLVNLLQKTTTDECSTNTVGIFTLMSNASVSDQVWIVDSGATHHVTHCNDALNNLRKSDHKADGDFYNGKVMGIGRENNGLYLIRENLPTAAISFLKEHGETTLWHLRLGHASTKAMQHISELKNKI